MYQKLRYQLIYFRDFVDQTILQSDWMRVTLGHIHPKMIVSDVTFPEDYLHAKNLRYQLFPFKKTHQWFNFGRKKQKKNYF